MTYHVLLEFSELTGRNVNHSLLGRHLLNTNFDLFLLRFLCRLCLAIVVILIFFDLLRQGRLLTVRSVSGTLGGSLITCLIEVINIVHEHTIEDLLVHTANLRLVVIQFHLLHFFIQLFGLIFSLLLIFLLLLLLLFSLDCLELIKHILIVQNGMRELIFEVVLVQKLLNPIPNDWILQDLIDVGSFIGLGV